MLKLKQINFKRGHSKQLIFVQLDGEIHAVSAMSLSGFYGVVRLRLGEPRITLGHLQYKRGKPLNTESDIEVVKADDVLVQPVLSYYVADQGYTEVAPNTLVLNCDVYP